MNKQRQQPDAAKVKAAPASPQEQSEEAAIAPYGNADRQALLAGEGQETGTVVGGAEGGGLLIDDEDGAPDRPPDVGFTLTLWRVRDEHIRELQRSNTDPGRVQQATQNAKQATDAVLRERPSCRRRGSTASPSS